VTLLQEKSDRRRFTSRTFEFLQAVDSALHGRNLSGRVGDAIYLTGAVEVYDFSSHDIEGLGGFHIGCPPTHLGKKKSVWWERKQCGFDYMVVASCHSQK
jgi:hypothetical protein